MNELILYSIFKQILTHSYVMEGRFIVAEGYGHDLNTNNFNDIVKDALDNYKPIGRKYPISVLMPPVETVGSYTKGWSRYKLDQFFLCTPTFTGAGDFKNLNPLTNTGEHPDILNWKDMRQVAGDFRKKFKEIIQGNNLRGLVNDAVGTKDFIRRVSNMGNDKLCGVHVNYELNIAISCDVEDYPSETIEININESEHLQHKH